MNNRSPSNRTPSNRGYAKLGIVLKQIAENITIGLTEVVTKTLITPIKKLVTESIPVFLSELSFTSKQVAPPEVNWIVLDSTLTKLYNLDASLVIEPLTVEDSVTGEHTLTFRYPVVESDDIIEGGQIILIKDDDGDYQPFRVVESRLSLYGENVLNVRCEHLFYEIANGLPQSYAVLNQTAAQALTMALSDVRWQVGTIDASITDQVDLSGSFDNPLKILRKIASDYSARLKFRATVGTTEITGLYVDMLEIDFEFSGQRFEFGHNLQGIDVNIDYSQVYTALTGIVPGATTDPITEEAVPLTFASAVWAIADGDPADKPATQTWVGNEAARLLYGIYNPDTGLMDHRYGIYDSGAATTADTLLAATWLIGERYHFAPKVNIEAKVADLNCVKIVDVTTGATVTLDDSKIRVGNLCYVIAREQGLYAAADVRIIRIERYLKEPEKTVVILGDALFAGSDFLRELQEEVDNKTRRRAQAPDRGPGAAVTIASADTSIAPEYADIIVPAAATNFELYMAQALADLPAEGGQILILEGLYTYSATMEITLDNVTITGQGEGTVIRLVAGSLSDTFAFQADSRSGFQISDITLDGNRINQTGSNNKGIEVSSEYYLPSEWAWYNNGALTGGSAPANATYGWAFTAERNCTVSKFRIYPFVTRTIKMDLWAASTGTKLATKSFACTSGTWNEVDLDTPINLTSAAEYRISYDYNASENAYYRAQADITDAEFNKYVDFIRPYFSTGHNTYPNTAEALSIGIVDLGISDFSPSRGSEFSIRNVALKNYDAGGIDLDGTINGEVINCRSVNSWYGLDVGSVLSGADAATSNIRIQGNEFNDCDTLGIAIITASNMLVQNNSLLDCDNMGMLIGFMTDSSIVGNTCRQGASSGIFTLAGIGLVLSDKNTVIGNVSSNNAYWGISIEGSNYNVVSNNTCNDSENASGILVDSGAVYNTIQGNKCQGNALYGINITAGSNNNQVTNNDLFGNTAGGLLNNGTGTITAAGNRT